MILYRNIARKWLAKQEVKEKWWQSVGFWNSNLWEWHKEEGWAPRDLSKRFIMVIFWKMSFWNWSTTLVDTFCKIQLIVSRTASFSSNKKRICENTFGGHQHCSLAVNALSLFKIVKHTLYNQFGGFFLPHWWVSISLLKKMLSPFFTLQEWTP